VWTLRIIRISCGIWFAFANTGKLSATTPPFTDLSYPNGLAVDSARCCLRRRLGQRRLPSLPPPRLAAACRGGPGGYRGPDAKILAIFDAIAEDVSRPDFRGCPFNNAAAEAPAGDARIARVLFTADHPYANMKAARQFLAQMPINPGDKEKIAHLNAERLLGLKG
jgi:hypothetical protein